jgi:GNAT superfamily N-acetyltransferase
LIAFAVHLRHEHLCQFNLVKIATNPEYEVSTDPARLNVAMIHEFLSRSYWAQNIPLSVVEKSIRHSLCFGVYHDRQQVGFARVVTDFATFGYLGDVFVLPEHRGRGVSKILLRAILEHSDLQSLRRLLLATHDAHGLYAQFGFQPLASPDDFMSIHRPDIYATDHRPPQTP